MALEVLETVAELWAVDILQDVTANLHDEVWPDTHDLPIEGVVQLAHRKAVADDRLAEWMGIGEDVGGIQEFHVTEPAESTRVAVRR